MRDTRCGLVCDGCEYKEKMSCGGCVATNGHPFHGECPVAVCCQEKGFDTCADCPDMPCALLQSYTEDPVNGDTPPGARVERLKSWRRRVLDARKVAYYGHTGDDRSPESLPLSACMTSMLEAMGEDVSMMEIESKGVKYIKRGMNDCLLSASGMAFALLWHREFCYSCLDVTQAIPIAEAVRRAFGFAGLAYEQIDNDKSGTQGVRDKIVRSIDRGAPVLAFGLFDPPECALITGYDDCGRTLLGWSHFQRDAGLPEEANGMFRRVDWEKEWWTLVIPGEKTERTVDAREIRRFGAEILRKTEADGYVAGQAAYAEWTRAIRESANMDASARESFYAFHHGLLFTLAELRCWGGAFLRGPGGDAATGNCFQQIHDLCWKADDACPNAKAMESADAREKLIGILNEIRALDLLAAERLETEA